MREKRKDREKVLLFKASRKSGPRGKGEEGSSLRNSSNQIRRIL